MSGEWKGEGRSIVQSYWRFDQRCIKEVYKVDVIDSYSSDTNEAIFVTVAQNICIFYGDWIFQRIDLEIVFCYIFFWITLMSSHFAIY